MLIMTSARYTIMKISKAMVLVSSLFLCMLVFASEVSDLMIEEFQAEAERPFSEQAGMETWYASQPDGRSCTSCHGESLLVRGSHQRTGKIIEPMAPSINPERLTERRHINKWFLRNCKWTYGRECTAQEKGDILLWLSQQ